MLCGNTTYYHAGKIDNLAIVRLELMKGLGVNIEVIHCSTEHPSIKSWNALAKTLRNKIG